jgi:2-polyprenyl-3-methyl-5-hydroxy-6-metoxy-1,4-benzoquinol methylase
MSPQEPGHNPSDLRYSGARGELASYVPRDARRVLDVGCAIGEFGQTIRERAAGAELWGVEPVEAAAEVARGVYDRVVTGFFPDDTGDLDGETFDAVFMLDVLEHMPQPEVALKGALPLIGPGGVLVASIPNVRHFDVWWPLVRHGRWTYTDIGLMDRTHLRWFTRSSIVDLFEATGWEIVTLDGINRSDPVGWKAKAIARLGRRTEDMFFVQYAVVARPRAT